METHDVYFTVNMYALTEAAPGAVDCTQAARGDKHVGRAKLIYVFLSSLSSC